MKRFNKVISYLLIVTILIHSGTNTIAQNIDVPESGRFFTLVNMALSRMSSMWQQLPTKYKIVIVATVVGALGLGSWTYRKIYSPLKQVYDMSTSQRLKKAFTLDYLLQIKQIIPKINSLIQTLNQMNSKITEKTLYLQDKIPILGKSKFESKLFKKTIKFGKKLIAIDQAVKSYPKLDSNITVTGINRLPLEQQFTTSQTLNSELIILHDELENFKKELDIINHKVKEAREQLKKRKFSKKYKNKLTRINQK